MIEVYEYTEQQYESMKSIQGVGFAAIDGKYYLPKDFVDDCGIEKGIQKEITMVIEDTNFAPIKEQLEQLERIEYKPKKDKHIRP